MPGLSGFLPFCRTRFDHAPVACATSSRQFVVCKRGDDNAGANCVDPCSAPRPTGRPLPLPAASFRVLKAVKREGSPLLGRVEEMEG